MSLGPHIKPRLLFLNRSYWPCAEATGQLLTELCEDLADQFEVTVLAGQPNHNPEGHAYCARGRQVRNGVRICRVWNPRFPKSSSVGKSFNLLGYLLGAFVASLRLPRPDIVIVETDPPLLCLLGAFLRRWYGCRLIIYLQDIYPDVAVALGALPACWPTTWLRRLMFWTNARADRVVVLSDDMRALMTESGIEAEKIVSIPNWVDTEHVRPVKTNNPFRARHGIDDRFVVMYSGNLGLSQRLEDLLDAASLLRHRDDIVWLLIGDGSSRRRLEAMAREQRLAGVRFMPYQPKSELAASLSAADLHVVPLNPKLVRYLMPSKIYGALASGTAVLSVAPPQCELARIIGDSSAGLVVRPESPDAIADAVRYCADHRAELEEMGARGRGLAESTYDRRRQTAKFARMLGDLLDLPASRSAASDSRSLDPAASAASVF